MLNLSFSPSFFPLTRRMYVLARSRSRMHRIIRGEGTHEKDEGALQGSHDMNENAPYSLHLKHKDLIKVKEERKKETEDQATWRKVWKRKKTRTW